MWQSSQHNLSPQQWTIPDRVQHDLTADISERQKQLMRSDSLHSDAVSVPVAELPITNCKADKKKETAIRWGYLLPRALLLIFFWGFMTFLVDPLIHYTATQSAAMVLRTPVGLDSVKSNLWQGKIEFERLQVADRDVAGVNAIEVARGKIQLDRRALSRKKFIINSGELTGIECNSLSSLAPAEVKQDEAGEWKFSREAIVIGNLARSAGEQLIEILKANAISQLNPEQLETVQLARVKEAAWKQRFERYETTGKDYEQRVAELKNKLEAIKRGNPLDQFQQSIEIAGEIEALQKESLALKKELAGLSPQLAIDFRELEAARQRDLARVQSQLASIPLNQEELTLALIGPEMAKRFEELAEWVAFMQRWTSLANQDFEPARTGGQTISFEHEQELPDFLLRQFFVSGKLQIQGRPAPFQLQLFDWTGEVERYRKPGRFELAFDFHGQHELQGEWDRSRDVPQLALNGRLQNCPSISRTWGQEEAVQVLFSPGSLSGDYQIALAGSQIQGHIRWKQTEVVVDVQELKEVPVGPAFQFVSLQQTKHAEIKKPDLKTAKRVLDHSLIQMLKESFSELQQIDGQVEISGTIDHPQWQIRSEAGEQVGRALKSSFRNLAEQQKTQAFHQATAAINQELSQLTHQIDDQYKLILGKLNVQEAATQQLIKQVADRPQADVLKKLFR